MISSVVSGIFLILFYSFLEFVYLSLSMPKLKQISAQVQNRNVKDLKPFKLWPFGILGYIIIILSIWILVLQKATNLIEVAIKGAILGLGIYGTYNITNYVFFERNDLGNAIFDTLYGVLAITLVSICTFLVQSYMSRLEDKSIEKK